MLNLRTKHDTMWLLLAFCSAFLLGLYDTSKKAALKDNAVLPVLFLNTVFYTLIFSWYLFGSASDASLMTWRNHIRLIIKSTIVLSSWICGYIALKHLPITVVGPINASRPMMVLVGAMLIFGERLNLWQWGGVLLSIFSIFLLSISSHRKEDVDLKWLWCTVAAAVLGAISGLYDKYIMKSMDPLFVQSWYNLYQALMMAVVCLLMRWIPKSRGVAVDEFRWSWAIPLISIFISIADFCYFSSLSRPGSMISIVSLVRRSSVIVSFVCGLLIFNERRNLKAKIFDLSMILAGMLMIWIGSR